MAVIVRRHKRRRIFSHGGSKVGQLDDFLIDLSAVVIIVRQGIMHFCGTQRRKLAQDLLNRQSAPIVLYDGADGKATPFNDRASPLDTGTPLDIGMKDFGRRRLNVHSSNLLERILLLL
jgi:hypothetical protein